jgi:Fe2+ transport system protein FeoA
MHKPTDHAKFLTLLRRWRAGCNLHSRMRVLDRQLHGPSDTPEPDGHVQMALSRMRPGEQGHVLSLCDECEARQHLLEMGFTVGTAVEVIRVAPLGDPLTVRIRGYQLSLRRREAEAVWMRRCPPELIDSPHDAAPPGAPHPGE